jgi:hypothetical protein
LKVMAWGHSKGTGMCVFMYFKVGEYHTIKASISTYVQATPTQHHAHRTLSNNPINDAMLLRERREAYVRKGVRAL